MNAKYSFFQAPIRNYSFDSMAEKLNNSYSYILHNCTAKVSKIICFKNEASDYNLLKDGFDH